MLENETTDERSFSTSRAGSTALGSDDLRLRNLDRVSAACAVEEGDLVHAGRSVRGTAVRAEDPRASSRRAENPACRAFPDARIKGSSVFRAGVEMGNRFLEPW